MKIDVQSPDFEITEAIEGFIQNSVARSFNAVADHVSHMTVRVRDVNGPKGGDDKECKVEVNLYGIPPVIISKRSSDLYAATKKVIARGARSSRRAVRKRLSARRLSQTRGYSYPLQSIAQQPS